MPVYICEKFSKVSWFHYITKISRLGLIVSKGCGAIIVVFFVAGFVSHTVHIQREVILKENAKFPSRHFCTFLVARDCRKH